VLGKAEAIVAADDDGIEHGDVHQAAGSLRLSGHLAGAVLWPTVYGGCERGQWHRTTPTTGLFQRDGGSFGQSGGVYAIDKGLIEGVERELTESMRELNASVRELNWPSMPSMRRDRRVNKAMPAPRMVTMMAIVSGFMRLILISFVFPAVKNGGSSPLALRGGLRELQDHKISKMPA
jgi:hypothetical protein